MEIYYYYYKKTQFKKNVKYCACGGNCPKKPFFFRLGVLKGGCLLYN